MTRVACPNCGGTSELWRGVMVSGYYVIDEHGEKNGPIEIDHAFHDERDEFGCASCQWTGFCLATLGMDGLPLTRPIRGQLEIAS
jgi:hypothetical protein